MLERVGEGSEGEARENAIDPIDIFAVTDLSYIFGGIMIDIDAGTSLSEDVGEIFIMFDGDEFGAGFESIDDDGSECAGSGAELYDGIGMVNVKGVAHDGAQRF